ncbi:3-isopropylmalate dehydratase large subunit [Pseudonocardia kunmingensis]|uniref:3-isopropylmalate dehydratase large subunit n=1 Tax=Pseudonocardia kunmingensis TaxID=630975 RepID=A0A543DPJ9_9PSEU|nr:3-isopropylmalate dehydratase large subunit [Pseudonocardia kunmingensis]TQM11262.1 3-isopropylmalate/(R)-2-methylmalate dehydratase large subunit [Pseudonocardia kunmingensis]
MSVQTVNPVVVGGHVEERHVTQLKTLYEKIWDDHVVDRLPDGTCLLAVDRQLIYEATSPSAFQGLRERGRNVRRPGATLAMADHTVATRTDATPRRGSLRLIAELRNNCADMSIPYIDMDDPRRGIVHVVGPEQGFTQPGLVIVCPDSHSSSHGALGALAFGIGSSELEHVLATQTLMQKPSRTMRVTIEGRIDEPVSAKDVALAVLGAIGAGGGIGHAIEFAGEAVTRLSVPGRLTLCNMAVEAGARCGLVAPDEVTFDWLRGRPMAPEGELWDSALAHWRTLDTDRGAVFDRDVRLDVTGLAPQVTWGTSPDDVVPVDGRVPDPASAPTAAKAASRQRALTYMDLAPGTPITDIPVDRVFVGSCTNSRLEDLRAAAAVARGRRLAPGVHGMVVPGSGLVKRAAEDEGLHDVFTEAGFEWREAGCSMCFASANDSVAAGQRCASTSNRNFENRQGAGARTHLVSPAMAVAAGVAGHFVDVRTLPTLAGR